MRRGRREFLAAPLTGEKEVKPVRQPRSFPRSLDTEVGVVAALTMVTLSACGASKARPSTAESTRAGEQTGARSGALGGGVGRWLRWSGGGRSWGSFVTASGPGPEWSLDVAGRGSWSSDGRWLTSCGSGFVAARFMAAGVPSRIALRNGGCSRLVWAPQRDTALAFFKASNQVRSLKLTAGHEPTIELMNFEIRLPEGEHLSAAFDLQWSPTGRGFLTLVSVKGKLPAMRYIDTVERPGQVQKLVMRSDHDVARNCWWSPNGSRFVCVVQTRWKKEEPLTMVAQALGLFETGGQKLEGRLIFDARWFALEKLEWLDDERVVFKDRDATRLLEVDGKSPPLTLSATASDFAVSPTASRVAYINHRGVCLRDGGVGGLGAERVLFSGKVQGVRWSSDGLHLLASAADLKSAFVIIEAASAKPRVEKIAQAPPELVLGAQFSAGGNMLFARALHPDPMAMLSGEAHEEPLQAWSLPEFVPRRFIPTGYGDHWFNQSPDDGWVVLSPKAKGEPPELASVRDGEAQAPGPLPKGTLSPPPDWQPGPGLSAQAAAPPPKPSDPHLARVELPPDHPISLGTVYLEGSMKCSGCLIDEHYVVTANHCVDELRGAVKVTVGRNLAWEQTFKVLPPRIIHHPRVRHVEAVDLFEYDFAVVELPEAAPPRARPFALARADEDVPGTEIFLAGYGGDRTLGLNAQPELRYGVSRLVPLGEGITGTFRWRSREGAESGGCFGDSGGPILVRRNDGSFALLGIHYGADTLDYEEACTNWGVAGNIAAEREWLNETLDKLSMSRRGSGPPKPYPKRL